MKSFLIKFNLIQIIRLYKTIDQNIQYCYKLTNLKSIGKNLKAQLLNLSKYPQLKENLDKYTSISKEIYDVMLENTIEIYENSNLLRDVEQNIKKVTCKYLSLFSK